MKRKRSASARRTKTVGPAFTVAIVGRPNVGKSTLFNRLVGRREALVHDRPGVTRDRREAEAHLADLHFIAIDTAGFEEARADSLEGRMRRQTEAAVADADVALFVIDGLDGVTPLDGHFAALLRRSRTPIILVANKCEGRAADATLLEAYSLGFGEPIALSAEHGEGMAPLHQALSPFAPPPAEEGESDGEGQDKAGNDRGRDSGGDIDETLADDPSRPLRLAVIGRPNTGKSTLINCLLGEERMLTGPEPGVTRDAVIVPWTYAGRPIHLVDTAGVRRRARVVDAVEKLAVGDSFNAIRLAEVVVLVLDGTVSLDKQELTLARHVAEEGRALVIAVNKWDAVTSRDETQKAISERLEESLTQVRGVPVVTISAKTGLRIDSLMDAVFKIHRVWNSRVATAGLNRWLTSATAVHPPPLSVHKHRIKLRYMAQTKTRPPTFMIFCSRADDLPEAYMRYLTTGLRESFGLDGVPLRLSLRKPKNPFADEDGK